MKKVTLKWFRKNEGLTQKQLAQKLDCAQGTVSMWENAKAIPTNHYLNIIKKMMAKKGFELKVSFWEEL